MGIEVCIRKKAEAFELNATFYSESKRIGILGASGCGKSMMLKCIAGIETPDSGTIIAEEVCLFDSKKRVNVKPQKRRVGYLFQNYALFPTMTVEENISAGLSGGKQAVCRRTEEMIRRFRLEGLEKRLPETLSGGQQQRVALARIMAYEPDMILLDEPFSALDRYLREEMQRELQELLRDYAGTVIMVSHDRDEIYRMSEEVLILDEGKLIRSGKTKEVFEDPRYIPAARLTGCDNIASAAEYGLPELSGTVGIRAHQLVRENQGEMLVFPVLDPIVTEDSLEYTVSFKAAEGAKIRIKWKVSKDRWNEKHHRMPEYLYLRNTDLLHLAVAEDDHVR